MDDNDELYILVVMVIKYNITRCFHVYLFILQCTQ